VVCLHNVIYTVKKNSQNYVQKIFEIKTSAPKLSKKMFKERNICIIPLPLPKHLTFMISTSFHTKHEISPLEKHRAFS
jgi:hypothetical protein